MALFVGLRVGVPGLDPGPLFAAIAGREWFVESGRHPGPALVDDIFASLR